MTYSQAPLEAAQHAKALLDAWNCGDIDGFQQYLEHSPRMKETADLPGFESERQELLDSIMQNLRLTAREKTLTHAACELQVSIQLLKHLVSTH